MTTVVAVSVGVAVGITIGSALGVGVMAVLVSGKIADLQSEVDRLNGRLV